MSEQSNVQWWLAELDQYGVGRPVDGPHSDRSGADKAMYLFNALGLVNGRRYAVAKVELFPPEPSAEGVNHVAVAECNKARAAAFPRKEVK